jgi:carbamoyl-phosphate synthase large subunit
MGVDVTFEAAVRKALIASDLDIRPGTPVLLSLSDRSKPKAVPLIRALHLADCPLYATERTAKLVESLDIPVTLVSKLADDGISPSAVELVRNGTIGAVVNTKDGTAGIESPMGFEMRRAAVEQRIPCFTSIDTAHAASQALASRCSYQIRPLIEYRDGVGTGRPHAAEVPA